MLLYKEASRQIIIYWWLETGDCKKKIKWGRENLFETSDTDQKRVQCQDYLTGGLCGIFWANKWSLAWNNLRDTDV